MPPTIQKNASMLRKYIFEMCILSLAVCVVFLFKEISSLNVFIRETLTRELIENRKSIDENTASLIRFNNQKP